MNKVQILVIEDDVAVGNLITTTLEMENYQFRLAKTAKQGIMNVLSYNPDIMLLDLGLPDMDGLEVIKKVRSWSNIPIIVVSARSEDQDKVQALDLGADDYLTKPFSVDELLARLRVTIRRLNNSQTTSVNESVYENGDLTINYAQGCVYENGREIHLTPIEYKLLCVLAKNTDKVLTHNYIMGEVWGSVQGTETPSLRVFMATLRKKIEPDTSNPKYIQTHVGVGYRMLRQTEKAGQTSESLS